MPTQADVRKLALALPNVTEASDRFSFVVGPAPKPKAFVWSWLERIDPKKARVENKHIVAVRVPNLEVKEALLASDTTKFFTEPHYNGYPAVMVRLAEVTKAELAELLRHAWECAAPKAVLKAQAAGGVAKRSKKR